MEKFWQHRLEMLERNWRSYGFKRAPLLGSLCLDLPGSHCGCVGVLQLLQLRPQSTDIHVRLTSNAEVSGSLSVSLCDEMVTCSTYTRLSVIWYSLYHLAV